MVFADLPLARLFFQRSSSIDDDFCNHIVEVFLSSSSEDYLSLRTAINKLIPAQELATPWQEIEKWKKFLLVNILVILKNAHSELRDSLEAFFYEMQTLSRWTQFQLVSALITLNAQLLGLDASLPVPVLSESGLPPMAEGGYHPCTSIPFLPDSIELGVYWSLIGMLANKLNYLEAAKGITNWLINTLDSNLLPFAGIFVKEQQSAPILILSNYYLLFKLTAFFNTEDYFGNIEQALLAQIKLKPEVDFCHIPLTLVLIECWIHQVTVARSNHLLNDDNYSSFLKDAFFKDISTALIGCRSHKENIVSTLYGIGSGLGSYHAGNSAIISYGPQHLPLGNCHGFGINGGGIYSPVTITKIEHESMGFSLKGTVKIVDKYLEENSYPLSVSDSMWLEINQEYQPGQLLIDSLFLGDIKDDAISFSYYIKAERCMLHKDHYLNRGTLDRYQGKPFPAIFETDNVHLMVKPLQDQGEMHIIPLAGGINFWGADFLIAYILSSEKNRYRWSIHVNHF